MERKENQRIMLTRKLLRDAFLKMLQTQPIHAISIRELCEHAGINRTTFYHHYSSQYALFDDISEHFLSQIAERLAEVDPENQESIQERVTLVFQYLEENPELSRLMLTSSIDPHFAEKLLALPKISDLLNASLKNCTDPSMRQAMLSFAIHGSYHLLQTWISSSPRLPAQAQARIILELSRRVCTDA